jgi:hypothetical protein
VDVTNRVHENSCIDDDHPCRARSSSSSAEARPGSGRSSKVVPDEDILMSPNVRITMS